MRSHGCCARAPEWRALTRSQRALVFVPAPPAPMLRTCCCWMTCSVSRSDMTLPQIDPDARRRRLTALFKAHHCPATTPVVFVVEDAQWIDEVSESMLAEFLAVTPQTRLLVLVTYRPEYHGALARVPGAQTIALAPLRDTESAELIVRWWDRTRQSAR